jgi:hypothetical protein
VPQRRVRKRRPGRPPQPGGRSRRRSSPVLRPRFGNRRSSDPRCFSVAVPRGVGRVFDLSSSQFLATTLQS